MLVHTELVRRTKPRRCLSDRLHGRRVILGAAQVKLKRGTQFTHFVPGNSR
jgi:hypothetical protein